MTKHGNTSRVARHSARNGVADGKSRAGSLGRFARVALVAALVVAALPSTARAQDPPPQRLEAESPVVNGYFGASVAHDGDTLVVGSREIGGGNGAADVFVRVDNVWVHQQRLTAPDPAGGDEFGASVAVDDDTVVVGAPGRDAEVLPGIFGDGVGAAFVFTRSGTTWSHSQTLVPVDRGTTDSAGQTVAIEGGTLLVGVPNTRFDGDGESVGASGGAVDVYVRDGGTGGTWSRQQRVQPTSVESFSGFRVGTSVALDGEALVTGALFDSTDESGRAGGAFVFVRTEGVWSEQGHLLAGDESAEFDRLGSSCAISGDTVLLGAPAADGDAGAAYVFVRDGGTWSKVARLTRPGAADGERFGESVALRGDAAYVGAIHVTSSTGEIVPFTRTDGSWTPSDALDAPVAFGSGLGASLAFGGGTLVAGAPTDNHSGSTPVLSAGAAVAFDLEPLSVDTAGFGPFTSGAQFTGALPSNGGTAPYAWQLIAGAVPFVGGLPVTGELDDTVGPPGDYHFTLGVRDADGRSADGAFVVTVNDALVADIPAALPPIVPGRPYSFAFAPSGGTRPFAFTAPGGDPLSGLVLGAGGTLAGTVAPADAMPVTFDVALADSGGAETAGTTSLVPAPLAAFPERKTKTAKELLEFDGTTSIARAFELAGGTLLSAVVKFPKSDAPPLALDVVDHFGQSVPVAEFVKTSRTTLKLRKLPIPATGRYVVRLVPQDGFDGTAKAVFSLKQPKKAGADDVVAVFGGPTVTVSFSALPGASLKVSVKAAKGNALEPAVRSIRDSEGNDLLVPGSAKSKGRNASAKALVQADTEIVMELAGTDGDGAAIDWRVKAKNPKGHPVRLPQLVSGRPAAE